MSLRRVVISGIGVVSPCGKGWQPYWDALLKGESRIQNINSFDLNGFPSKLVGQIPEFNPAKYIKQRKMLKLMSRDIQLAVIASQLAVEDGSLSMGEMDPFRVGVSLGAGLLNSDLDDLAPSIQKGMNDEGVFDYKKFGQEGLRQLYPLWFLKYLPNMPACHIAISQGLRGPNNTITTSAAAGAQAIGEAFGVIQRGDADVMFAGGSDSKTNPMGISRFHLLGLLSSRNGVTPDKVYCPFDLRRDGMVLGEGAGIIILEEREHAIKRGAKIYGELVGYGSSSDFNFDPRSTVDYTGKSLAMRRALNHAEMEPDQIDFLLANGSGIPQDDIQEARAVHSVFKKSVSKLKVTAVKPVTGHLVYGAGGVEMAAALLSMRNKMIPPVLNLEEEDPRCDLNMVTKKPQETEASSFMFNSFGFGGQNATLVVKQ